MPLTSDAFATLVGRASLAPSVHNTQPTRWRLAPDGSVLVFEETARRLPVGDRSGRDAAASHGAAIEGFAIAGAAAGMTVRADPLEGPDEGTLRPVARLTLSAGATDDPLGAYVDSRRTYRGAFAKATSPAKTEALMRIDDVVLVRTTEGRARLAELNDRAALRTYRDGAYRGELRSWMRLSRRDPRWALDGLNAASLEMSPVQAAGAGVVIAPRVFELLDRVGIGAPLVSEAAVVRSAEAIVLFHRPEAEDPLATGRRWYRLCLECERAGVAAAPMSVISDDAETSAIVEREFALPAGRRLVNAFRVGVPPPRSEPRARLPLASLIV